MQNGALLLAGRSARRNAQPNARFYATSSEALFAYLSCSGFCP